MQNMVELLVKGVVAVFLLGGAVGSRSAYSRTRVLRSCPTRLPV